jgi:hypothetical protein
MPHPVTLRRPSASWVGSLLLWILLASQVSTLARAEAEPAAAEPSLAEQASATLEEINLHETSTKS